MRAVGKANRGVVSIGQCLSSSAESCGSPAFQTGRQFSSCSKKTTRQQRETPRQYGTSRDRSSPSNGEVLLLLEGRRGRGCRMAQRLRSQKQAQRRRADTLRSEGKTWGEVAAIFRDEYGVNARVALRLAHGWSQGDAADRWNERWPDDLKTFKNISYWERWPAASGYTPSLDVLTRLSDLYECHVAELLADSGYFRDKHPVCRTRAERARLPAISSPGTAGQDQSSDPGVGSNRDALAIPVTRLD